MPDCPVVQTLLGKVKGRPCLKAKPEEAKQVYNYAGIPFAKPPVGELRFEPPQKCECWDGILHADALPPAPLQGLRMGEQVTNDFILSNQFDEDLLRSDEDCLYLNVFTSNPDSKANIPVMFWIYGGALQMGGSGGYDGQALCGLHDVVLVVPNYRVNIFGFFTTGKNTPYPGNIGMLDQVMALKWVRDNIRNFGGNPDNVTIFGESAGSLSVALHMFSPMSKGLFHRAIQHSGAATSPALVKQDFSEELQKILKILKINETDPKKIAAKLKALPASALAKADKSKPWELTFCATIDGRFITEERSKLLERGSLSPVPCMIGCNNTEMCGMLSGQEPPSFKTGFSEEEFTRLTKSDLAKRMPDKPEKVDQAFEAVKSLYELRSNDDDQFKWSKIRASVESDVLFIVPTVYQSIIQTRFGQPTYLYYMTQQLKCHHDENYGVDVKMKAEFCECDHGDDVVFTFGLPIMNGKMRYGAKFSKEEEQLSRAWMAYITNFAASGNPNVGVKMGVEWPLFDPAEQRYLSAQIPLAERRHLSSNRYKLWKEHIPSI